MIEKTRRVDSAEIPYQLRNRCLAADISARADSVNCVGTYSAHRVNGFGTFNFPYGIQRKRFRTGKAFKQLKQASLELIMRHERQ